MERACREYVKEFGCVTMRELQAFYGPEAQSCVRDNKNIFTVFGDGTFCALTEEMPPADKELVYRRAQSLRKGK